MTPRPSGAKTSSPAGAAPAGLLVFAPLGRGVIPDASADALAARYGLPVATGPTMGQIARMRGLIGFHNQAHAALAVA